MRHNSYIIIHPEDNVATAIAEIPAGEEFSLEGEDHPRQLVIRDTIPYGHKFATVTIDRGSDVIKYGECIGRAVEDIDAGRHVHTHNVESLRGRGDLGG